MNILDLNKNILIHTLSFLREEDLKNCLLTCKRLRECAYQNFDKILFRNLETREISKVLNGPCCDLGQGGHTIPIGLKVRDYSSFQTLFEVGNHKNEGKLKISKIKLAKQSRFEKANESISDIFPSKKEQLQKRLERIRNIFPPSEEQIEHASETIKKNLKILTPSILILPILSFEELDHLLKLEKNFHIPARIFVKISDINDNTLDLWKSNLENLPPEIKVYGLSFERSVDKSIFKIDRLRIYNNEKKTLKEIYTKIQEICNSFQIKTLLLKNYLNLDLSNCKSILKLEARGADYSRINLILPEQLQTLTLKVLDSEGIGINGSRCSNLTCCRIYRLNHPRITLPKNIQEKVSFYAWDDPNMKKRQVNREKLKISWV